MTLVKLARPGISRTFDSMLNSFFEEMNTQTQQGNVWRPAMDVRDMEKSYELAFSLPGFDKKDITISVKNNALTLTASKEEVKEEQGEKYLAREIASGSYERIIELPENANTEKIVAKYKSGILSLSVPKVKEGLAKEIPITVK